jgi:phosphorylated adapter RNA export protein
MPDRLTAARLGAVLHETQLFLLKRILTTLGEERTILLLADALNVEHQGGMLLKDGSRKRTMGGIFLRLCREQATATERRAMFR